MLSTTLNKHAACSVSQAQVCYLGVCLSDFATDSAALILAACHDFVLQQVEDSLNANADTHCRHILTAEHAHQLVIPALYGAPCHWNVMCEHLLQPLQHSHALCMQSVCKACESMQYAKQLKHDLNSAHCT